MHNIKFLARDYHITNICNLGFPEAVRQYLVFIQVMILIKSSIPKYFYLTTQSDKIVKRLSPKLLGHLYLQY